MAKSQSNRGSRSAGGSRNNNPEGRNQYTSGWVGMARERPATTAAAAAGAVAAGVFLWSKRAQISQQISQLSDQIGEWTENMSAERADAEFETVGSDTGITGSSAATAGEFGKSARNAARSGRSTGSTIRRPSSRASGSPTSVTNGGAST